VRNKNLVDSIKTTGAFDCAAFINISNKSDLKATNVTIVGPNSQGMIAEGRPFDFQQPASLPSFSEITSKKNIGDLLPRESREYLVLSHQYSCRVGRYSSEQYSVVHDKGVAYFEEFPETYGLVNLALRHQTSSFILIYIGMTCVFLFGVYSTAKLMNSISTALHAAAPPAEPPGDKPP
jgi:hypothetical protein